MRKLTLLTIILFGILACKKVPERQFIDLELLTINGLTPQGNNQNQYDVSYMSEYAFEFSFESDYPLENVYIQDVDDFRDEVDGSDEKRIDHLPSKGDEKGKFIYNFNTSDQSEHVQGSGEETKETIKLVFTNQVGTVVVKNIIFKIQ